MKDKVGGTATFILVFINALPTRQYCSTHISFPWFAAFPPQQQKYRLFSSCVGCHPTLGRVIHHGILPPYGVQYATTLMQMVSTNSPGTRKLQ
jgi:hypothetical protein